jgi:hypothetical protein
MRDCPTPACAASRWSRPRAAPVFRSAPRHAAGETKLNGSATVYGDVTLAGGAVEFGVGAVRARRPWSIYRVEAADAANAALTNNELRIEMAAPGAGGLGGLNQAVIGAWSEKTKKFEPCLTIADDCSVTVHGNLKVEGTLTAPRGTQLISAEARSMLAAGLLSGVSGANILLATATPATLGVPSSGVQPAFAAAGPDAEATAATLEADPERLARFIEALANHPDLATRLRDALSPGEPAEGGDT